MPYLKHLWSFGHSAKEMRIKEDVDLELGMSISTAHGLGHHLQLLVRSSADVVSTGGFLHSGFKNDAFSFFL